MESVQERRLGTQGQSHKGVHTRVGGAREGRERPEAAEPQKAGKRAHQETKEGP